MVLKALLIGSSIHSNRKAKIVSLIAKKLKIFTKYFEFPNGFLEEKLIILPEQTKLNKYAIELKVLSSYSIG